VIRGWLGGLLLLGVCSCSAPPPGVHAPDPAGARRVIALAPHAAELVFAVGAGDRLVGVVAGSDYPAPARDLPVIGDSVRLDRERILALRPDLAVAWVPGNREADLDWLATRGVPVYRSDPHRIEAIAQDLQALGALTGHVEDGRAAAEAFRARLAHLRRAYAGIRALRAFYMLWPEPLMTVGGPSLISRAMKICGFENPFASQPAETLALGRESLIAARPAVLLVPGSDPSGAAAHLLDSGRWPGPAPAVAPVDPDLIERPGPRMLDGIEELCRARQALMRGRSGD